MDAKKFYGGVDPRDIPTHTLTEASHHLRIPKSTLRSWVVGTNGSQPLFLPARPRPITFSFWNLIEGEVLGALRRKHDIPMQQVRPALAFLQERLNHSRPLITGKFLADRDGARLFVEAVVGTIVDARRGLVVELTADLAASLDRIELAQDKLASAYYPWLRDPKHHTPNESDPKVVRIDPLVSFGRPVVKGTGTPTEVLAERYRAGDQVVLLSKDYGLSVDDVVNAIEWERAQAEAA